MTEKRNTLSSPEKARLVAGWLREKKAKDLVALDVSRICTVTEVMVLATAGGVRQAQALADHLLARCAENRIAFLGMDGYKTGQWILVDLNDVLAHIFLEDARSFYNLEGLWSEGDAVALPEEPEGPR